MSHFNLIPANLASVAKACSTDDERSRFATDSVQVKFGRGGGWTVNATNTKTLVRISGRVADADTSPLAVDSVDGDMIFGRDEWHAAMTYAEKTTRRAARRRPIIGNVKASPGRIECLNEALEVVGSEMNPGEGRFPPCDDIIVQSRKQEEVVAFGVSLRQLKKLIDATLPLFDKEQDAVVTMTVRRYADGRITPLEFGAKPEGVKIEAFIQPCPLE